MSWEEIIKMDLSKVAEFKRNLQTNLHILRAAGFNEGEVQNILEKLEVFEKELQNAGSGPVDLYGKTQGGY